MAHTAKPEVPAELKQFELMTHLGIGHVVTLWGTYKQRLEARNKERIAEFDRLHKLAKKQDRQACEDYKRKLEANHWYDIFFD